VGAVLTLPWAAAGRRPRDARFVNLEPVCVLYLGYRGSSVTVQNLDMTDFLQRHTAGEPNTHNRIRPHHSWLKKKGLQRKKTKLGRNRRRHLSHLDRHGRIGFYHLSAQPASSPWLRIYSGSYEPRPGVFGIG
jgi:hypothetical protein